MGKNMLARNAQMLRSDITHPLFDLGESVGLKLVDIGPSSFVMDCVNQRCPILGVSLFLPLLVTAVSSSYSTQ